MNMLEKLVGIFYTGEWSEQGVPIWDTLSLCTLVFRVLMFLSIGLTILFFKKYAKDYRIFHSLFAKIKGNAAEYDRIRRTQMRTEIEQRADSFKKEKKESLINKFYAIIAMTGITEKIPGFSESGFFAVVVLVDASIFLTVSYLRSPSIALIFAAAFIIVMWYSLSLLAYNRKIKLEAQLLQFTNACASASAQYSNLIDIFGAIYNQFSSPLKEGLIACYVEAKQTNDRELAIKHLLNRYDSKQFAFIVDNMELCSQATGDYRSAAKDLSETIAIYNQSHEKKRVILRNAKINIFMMFAVSLGILYSLSIFLGTLTETLFSTFLGNLAIVILVLLLFYGLNMKTEK